jgi:hypothetical protein
VKDAPVSRAENRYTTWILPSCPISANVVSSPTALMANFERGGVANSTGAVSRMIRFASCVSCVESFSHGRQPCE